MAFDEDAILVEIPDINDVAEDNKWSFKSVMSSWLSEVVAPSDCEEGKWTGQNAPRDNSIVTIII